MATVRILANVFDRGEVKFTAGTVVEVPEKEVAALVRRGWAAIAEPAPVPVVETKKKGK